MFAVNRELLTTILLQYEVIIYYLQRTSNLVPHCIRRMRITTVANITTLPLLYFKGTSWRSIFSAKNMGALFMALSIILPKHILFLLHCNIATLSEHKMKDKNTHKAVLAINTELIIKKRGLVDGRY